MSMFVEHKEIGEVTEAPARLTKLSQLIREGAKLRPQTTGRFWWEGKSCALGAAYEAACGHIPAGGDEGPWVLSSFASAVQCKAWGELQRLFPDAPYDKIYVRNDRGDTREQIADWLEAQGY
jgi:hypothetical protein